MSLPERTCRHAKTMPPHDDVTATSFLIDESVQVTGDDLTISQSNHGIRLFVAQRTQLDFLCANPVSRQGFAETFIRRGTAINANQL